MTNEHMELLELKNIIASANMGTWHIELIKNQEPRMQADEKMQELLGIEGLDLTPEETYTGWFGRIKEDAVPSVLASVQRMTQGHFDENTYIWVHPTKGERYVRCGGTAIKVEGGYILRGYHYDVDDIVREEKAKELYLQSALDAAKATREEIGVVHRALGSGDWGMTFNENFEMTSCTWSDTFRKMLDYESLEDFPDKLESWSDLLEPDDHERVLKHYWMLLTIRLV